MTITGEDCQKYREHSLNIQNPNKVELYYLQAELHLPERAARACVPPLPWLDCRFLPRTARLQVKAKGKGSVKVPPQQPSSLWELAIDRLPAGKQIEILFWTIPPRSPETGLSTGMWETLFSAPGLIVYFIDGTYQFSLWNEYITRTFVVPLTADTEKRTIGSEPIRESPEPKRIVKVSGFNI